MNESEFEGNVTHEECVKGANAAFAAARAAVEAARAASTESAALAARAAAGEAVAAAEFWSDCFMDLEVELSSSLGAMALAEAESAYEEVVRVLAERGLLARREEEAEEAEVAAALRAAVAKAPTDEEVEAAWAKAIALGEGMRGPRGDESHEAYVARFTTANRWAAALPAELRDAVANRAYWALERLEDELEGFIHLVSNDEDSLASHSAGWWLSERDKVESVVWVLHDSALREAARYLDREAGTYATTWSMIEVPALPAEVNARFREDRDGLTPSWWSQFAD